MIATDRPRRDGVYVTRSVRAVTTRIVSAIADPTVPAPTGPMPKLPPRSQEAFDRIMAACSRTPAPAADVRSSSVPPPRKPRRR